MHQGETERVKRQRGYRKNAEENESAVRRQVIETGAETIGITRVRFASRTDKTRGGTPRSRRCVS